MVDAIHSQSLLLFAAGAKKLFNIIMLRRIRISSDMPVVILPRQLTYYFLVFYYIYYFSSMLRRIIFIISLNGRVGPRTLILLHYIIVLVKDFTVTLGCY